MRFSNLRRHLWDVNINAKHFEHFLVDLIHLIALITMHFSDVLSPSQPSNSQSSFSSASQVNYLSSANTLQRISTETQRNDSSITEMPSSVIVSESLPLITQEGSQWIMNPFRNINQMPSNQQLLLSNDISSMFASNFVQFPNVNTMSIGNVVTNSSQQYSKEVIYLKSCTLYPPRPNAPLPSTRERPVGCRTVFVGGLPENITEDIIEEMFEHLCGEICAIRMGKKNFCHIRFSNESSVDHAIAFSCYRIKIADKEDTINTGRLHIDYAQARDDLYDWQCKQRALQRELRHKSRLEQDQLCPPSPPQNDFNEQEAFQLIDKLKSEQTFLKTVQVLISWLEKGECHKSNSGQFFTMIQSTHSHIRRLKNERICFEEDWQQAKQLYQMRMQRILTQCKFIYNFINYFCLIYFINILYFVVDLIEKVFEAALKQKVWDHFTKAQRKHINSWYKSTKVRLFYKNNFLTNN